jgi:phage-related baseplate assembly protein
MVNIRSINEIISNLIDFFNLAQPNLDVKPGTVARDLMIEGPAAALSLLYDEVSGVSGKQSLRLSIGSDLDKLANNFGLTRKSATSSTGVALLTFSTLNANINVNRGTSVYTGGGTGFTILNGLALVPSNLNYYRSTATKFQAQLAYAGITDQYAVEVTVQAIAPGTSGNIGQYSLRNVSIAGIHNVTNIAAFSGGTDQETDAAFRSRILATFSGSSVGTKLGYLNAAQSVSGVQDVAIIEPGDPLMTRDGTISEIIDGALTVVSEGSGGKVDVVVLGTIEVANTDTFIYQDHSNNNDPTNSANDWVLGQLASNENMSISQKRIVDLQNAQLPAQPIGSITQVTGSKSGSNFVEYSVDSYGRGTGNYKLVKDDGIYGGSAFGFDTFVWTDDKVEYQEDLIKGQSNGQDATTFTEVSQITAAQQQIGITNENSGVTYDRSIIQLLHTPAMNVTRVFNTNTGERYFVTNQNYDNTSPNNTSGRIQISGNTLPSPTDILQVDYTWIVNYDPYSDFDGLTDTHNSRTVTDSVDWGYSSLIKNELVSFTQVTGNNFFSGNTTHPIDTIISVDSFLQVDGYVQLVTSGNFINRLSVVLTNLSSPTTSVDSITWKNSNSELYKTAQNNTNFSNTAYVISLMTAYLTTIILPSDTPAQIGDYVTVYLNSTNVFQSSSAQGSSNGTQITIPSSLIDISSDGYNVDTINLRVTYIASISDLFSSTTGTLPASRIGNGYLLSDNGGFNNFSIANISRREMQVVQQNLNNVPSQQLYVQLNLATDSYLTASNVLSIVRLSDGKELWNPYNMGTIGTSSTTNSSGYSYYQLFLDGYNSPVAADRVLVIYYAPDVIRFQPISFGNEIIKTRIDTIGYDTISNTNDFVIPLIAFTSQSSGLYFEIIEENTDGYLLSITDGYLTSMGTSAALNSLSVNFAQIIDLTNKRIRITNATNPNNNGYFDILSYNSATNTINITTKLNKITADQISVIRIIDGQELWNYSGTIDHINNRLLMTNSNNASFGDNVFVMFFNFKTLRQSPSRIVGSILDNVTNTGVMTISGTTINLAQDIIFTAGPYGLQQSLLAAMRQLLGLSSSASVSSNMALAKIVKMEKVSTYTTGSNIVLETLATYDVFNTTIANNLFYPDTMLENSSLGLFDFILPSTSNNLAASNLPSAGDQIRITFYYTINDASENLMYTRMSPLYTNNRFALINQIYVSSGFSASSNTKFTATSFVKPSTGARYSVYYNYLAPKQNERIVINYTYNNLIANVTFVIEENRPVNSDVLTRAAKLVLLDLTMNIVINSSFSSTQDTVIQNVKNQLLAALTTNTLGQTIDQITLINTAQGVQGVDRARILAFNISGISGQVPSIVANEDQYFNPNTITINVETR